ncbi:hypothetical protein RM555_12160 [Micromonospora sp. DSM 115977]|uniref:Uncharacterized protein n=1 Tax=Micromonospora reichwaldensis TaxID=3075516 RepID=A0ABU2WUY9_9ACTN|nr:hypothetical protein [Micromonospora sp. DSM 115977]MDT0529743.1 hypothetical protein [Micromonospora sp. DSM 115977]
MSELEFQSRRQAGLAALYLGVFATIWFSVPAAEQPLRALLVVASGAALVTAVIGAVVVARSRGAGGVAHDRAADRRYLLIVLAEFAAAGLGAVVLALVGWSEFIPVLVGAVVGLHFFPLVPVLRDPLLWPLGVAVCAVAVAGLVTALVSAVPAGLVVGTGTGLLLLAYAVQALLRAARKR